MTGYDVLSPGCELREYAHAIQLNFASAREHPLLSANMSESVAANQASNRDLKRNVVVERIGA